jgi:mono/diheme cytochrome c family protein
MQNLQASVAVALVLLAALMLLAGWLAADEESPDRQTEDQPFNADLAAAYVKAGCWQCHSVSTLDDELTQNFGAQAAGDLPVGPDLAGIGSLYHPDWHVAHFWEPQSVVAGSQMPAQRFLFEGKKLTPLGAQVVDFLLTLRAPGDLRAPWPVVVHSSPGGDAARGRELFLAHCSGCHGDGARGDGPAARWIINARKPANLAAGQVFRGKDRDAVFTTITNGLPYTAMPSFHNLPEQDRADLSEYVAGLLGG